MDHFSSLQCRKYPNMCVLAQIALLIPVSTVECERGFSAMKRIKTALRNLLGEEMLEALMFLSIEAEDRARFPFEVAVRRWFDKSPRRVEISVPTSH